MSYSKTLIVLAALLSLSCGFGSNALFVAQNRLEYMRSPIWACAGSFDIDFGALLSGEVHAFHFAGSDVYVWDIAKVYDVSCSVKATDFQIRGKFLPAVSRA